MYDHARQEALRAELDAARRLINAGPLPVHMLGIGGVGMAGLAFHLAHRGFKVTGCDAVHSSVTAWLAQHGIPVTQGHSPDHLAGAQGWLIRSAAVDDAHPEIQAARACGLPVLSRGAVLPAILDGYWSVAVSGTHGKTTTTAMITHILRQSGIEASFAIGGEAEALGGVAGAGGSDVFVAEADESDGSVQLYDSDCAVITNADWDHVDNFKTPGALVSCLQEFARRARRRIIYGADQSSLQEAFANVGHALGFGISERAALRAADLAEGPQSIRCKVFMAGNMLGDLVVPVPGAHNVLNALAALAVGLDMGITFAALRQAFVSFRPVRRRFERIANARGIEVFSDYAHHPTEIRALIRQAKGLRKKRILAVFQPHRYSRTAALGPDFPPAFLGVSELVLVPVYAASEAPVPGGRAEDLMAHFARDGEIKLHFVQSLLDAWEYIRKIWRKDDLVLVIGAGDVELIANWARDELVTPPAGNVNDGKFHNIAVLKGGPSEERDVSLNSGSAVAQALREAGYLVSEIDVTSTALSLPPGTDAVFIALHGTFGEDGDVQRILEQRGVPFTGSDSIASKKAFDKIVSKRIFEENNIPTPRFEILKAGQMRTLPLPVVVKPPRQGSSIGVTIVERDVDWDRAMNLALEYDAEVLVEAYVPGAELTVGIVDNQVLPIIEIRAPKGNYSYAAKYTKGATEYIVPAPLTPEQSQAAQDLAWRAYEALGCRGMGRVDLRMSPNGEMFVLEVNTIPGFTATSLLPKAARAAGIEFNDLCVKILNLAER